MKNILKDLARMFSGSKVEKSQDQVRKLKIEELETRVNTSVGWGCKPTG